MSQSDIQRQVTALKDELSSTKTVLQQCEDARKAEFDRCSDLSTRLTRLMEANCLLQAQLDSAQHKSAAQQQVVSLERRLQAAEDALRQYHDTRCNQVSEIEEKLINENTHLQIAHIEFQRQIDHLRNQCSSLENKLHDARASAAAAAAAAGEQRGGYNERGLHLDEYENNRSLMTTLQQRITSGKFDEDVMFIIDCLKTEFNIEVSDRDRERQAIWLIWNQRENINKSWKKCEALLSTFTTSRDLRLVQPEQRHEELVLNKIKLLVDEVNESKRKLEDSRVCVNDAIHSKQDTVKEFQRVVNQLVQEKNSLTAQLNSLKDKYRSLRAANDVEKETVNEMRHSTNGQLPASAAAQFEKLKLNLQQETSKVRHFERTKQLLETQVNSLQLQVSSLEAQVSNSRRQLDDSLYDAQRLQADHKLTTDQHLRELYEFKSQVADLESECEELREKLRQSAAEQFHSEVQAKDSRAVWEQKLDELNSLNKDIQQELQSVRKQLQVVNSELTVKDTILKQKEVEIVACEEYRRKSDSYCRQCDSILSKKFIDSLISSLQLSEVVSESDVLAELSTKFIKLSREKDAMEATLEKLKEFSEKLSGENADLLAIERSLRQQLTSEHVELRRVRCEKNDHESRHYTPVSFDRRVASFANNSTSFETTQSLVENSSAMIERKQYEDVQNVDKLKKEVTSLKRLLDTREHEIDVLQRTVESQKQEHLAASNSTTAPSVSETFSSRRRRGNEQSETYSPEDQLEPRQSHSKVKITGITENHSSTHRTTVTPLRNDQSNNELSRLQQELLEMHSKMRDQKRAMTQLRNETSEKIDTLEKFHHAEKSMLNSEKIRLETESIRSKNKTEDLSEQIRIRDAQIEVLSKLNKELEEKTNHINELEDQVEQYEKERLESCTKMARLEAKIECVTAENKQLELLLEQSNTSSKMQQDEINAQMQRLRKQVNELKLAQVQDAKDWELEKAQLLDQLQTLCREDSVHDVIASHASGKSLISQSSAVYEQVIKEVSARKAAEHKANYLQRLLDDLRQKKFGLDTSTSGLRQRLNSVETELSVEKEKNILLKQELVNHGSIWHAKTLDDDDKKMLHVQVAELQAECRSLRRQNDADKQDYATRVKQFTQELSKNQELFDEKRLQLVQELEHSKYCLQKVEEELFMKAETNSRIELELQSVNERLRNTKQELSKAQKDLLSETSLRENLAFRNKELELLLIKLEAKIEFDSQFEENRNEVTRKIRELSQHMEEQFDAQRDLDTQLREKESHKLQEFRDKMTTLETALSQEQALHRVTKVQLSSVQEDNQRLRQQLQATRKRATSIVELASSKSRMEEINEIIMRSQVRAQQLLSTGSYYSTFFVGSAAAKYEQQSPMLELTLCSPTSASMSVVGVRHGDEQSNININFDGQSQQQERLLTSVPGSGSSAPAYNS